MSLVDALIARHCRESVETDPDAIVEHAVQQIRELIALARELEERADTLAELMAEHLVAAPCGRCEGALRSYEKFRKERGG